jgi:hypothetical protein
MRNKQHLIRNLKRNCQIATIAALCWFAVLYAKTDVPLFLLSGQSNMAGMQNSVNDLSADQKKTVDNVKIYQASEGSYQNKWSTLGPGFGSSSQNLGPELLLGKTLSDSLPGKKIAFIKDSRSGTYLGKATEWLPPSSNNGTGGTYYTAMMNHIDAALKAFNSAFDTTQYTPRWAGFVWLQGEFDAMDQNLANKYETNLTNLIKDIRTKASVEDLPVILPMIDVQSAWTYNSKVRAADVACKQKLKNVDTMDTKGLPTNGIHYSAAGQVVIGRVSAQRWLAMKFTASWWESAIVYRSSDNKITPVSRRMSAAGFPVAMFDLRGRSVSANNSPRLIGAHGIFIIRTGDMASVVQHPIINILR